MEYEAIRQLFDGYWVIPSRYKEEAQPKEQGSEELRDGSTKGLSFRSTTRKAPRDVRKRGTRIVQQARDERQDDQEVGS